MGYPLDITCLVLPFLIKYFKNFLESTNAIKLLEYFDLSICFHISMAVIHLERSSS